MEKSGSNNLCNIYVLPLLNLNKFSFGDGRFINSYVSEDDNYVIVESSKPFTATTTKHANFSFSMEREENYLAVFNVPHYYKEDVKKFRKGLYSKFTESAKDKIRKGSGLPHRAPGNSGQYRTAKELLALDKDPILKKFWEDTLKVKIDDDAELFDIPSEKEFYNLNLTTQLI